MIVHILHEGFPLCRFSVEVPAHWPKGEHWVPASDSANANCARCLEALKGLSNPHMTLAEIKAMFQPGQVWIGKRSPGDAPRGNMEPVITERRVLEVLTTQIIFEVNGRRYWTKLPKASEVLEARPGYLRFAVPQGTSAAFNSVGEPAVEVELRIA
jgi:hypothetical protein